MKNLTTMLNEIMSLKNKMIKQGLPKAKANCPGCRKKTLVLTLHPYRRKDYHIHASCGECSFTFME
jgi:hypothetical protein